MNTHQKPLLILFDVNETLLDMSDVKAKVNKALGSKRAFKLWFGLLLQYSLVETVTGSYHDFGTIAGATLDMTANALESILKEEDKQEILKAMSELPPHTDVKEGLQLLKSAGYRLATLTNSPPSTLAQQLQDGGLSPFFEATLSVDAYQIYKPHSNTYTKALEHLGVTPAEAILVAAHGWDIAGAMSAGMQAAFIKRKGQSLYPLAPPPQYQGGDLIEVAQAIIKQ